MINTIELRKCEIDFEKIEKLDFKKGVNIVVHSEIQDLLLYIENKEVMDTSFFGLFIEFGEEKEKTIMLDAPIDDLELFAKSILAHIDIVRKNYGEQIKIQTNWGAII
jgi:hypothetical protein